MKKITTVLVFTFILLAPVASFAMTSADVTQLIANLKSQPVVLGASAGNGSTSEVRRPMLSKEEQAKVLLALKYAKGKSMIVDKPIVVGSADRANITALQQFLIAKGYLNAEANGFFGPLTRAALRQYQMDRHIVGGNGLRVGPATMAAISADVATEAVSAE